jgi:methionyl-tRNA synthetase
LRQGHEIPRPEPLFRKLSDDFIKERTAQSTIASKETRTLSLQEFSKIDLKVGTIVKAESVPGSTKLARLIIDLGGGECKQSIAGLADQYELGQLVGRQVAVVANLVPIEVMKQKSEVMILAADDSGKLAILTPDKKVGEGTKIR